MGAGGKEMAGGKRKNMRINHKINDAATPGGTQSAEKDTPERHLGNRLTSRLLVLIDRRLFHIAHPPSEEKRVGFLFYFVLFFHLSALVPAHVSLDSRRVLTNWFSESQWGAPRAAPHCPSLERCHPVDAYAHS